MINNDNIYDNAGIIIKGIRPNIYPNNILDIYHLASSSVYKIFSNKKSLLKKDLSSFIVDLRDSCKDSNPINGMERIFCYLDALKDEEISKIAKKRINNCVKRIFAGLSGNFILIEQDIQKLERGIKDLQNNKKIEVIERLKKSLNNEKIIAEKKRILKFLKRWKGFCIDINKNIKVEKKFILKKDDEKRTKEIKIIKASIDKNILEKIKNILNISITIPKGIDFKKDVEKFEETKKLLKESISYQEFFIKKVVYLKKYKYFKQYKEKIDLKALDFIKEKAKKEVRKEKYEQLVKEIDNEKEKLLNFNKNSVIKGFSKDQMENIFQRLNNIKFYVEKLNENNLLTKIEKSTSEILSYLKDVSKKIKEEKNTFDELNVLKRMAIKKIEIAILNRNLLEGQIPFNDAIRMKLSLDENLKKSNKNVKEQELIKIAKIVRNYVKMLLNDKKQFTMKPIIERRPSSF